MSPLPLLSHTHTHTHRVYDILNNIVADDVWCPVIRVFSCLSLTVVVAELFEMAHQQQHRYFHTHSIEEGDLIWLGGLSRECFPLIRVGYATQHKHHSDPARVIRHDDSIFIQNVGVAARGRLLLCCVQTGTHTFWSSCVWHMGWIRICNLSLIFFLFGHEMFRAVLICMSFVWTWKLQPSKHRTSECVFKYGDRCHIRN